MPTNLQRTLGPYPQSVGNVAVADESLGLLHTPKAKTRPQLQAVRQATRDEVANSDDLAPARGVIVALGLSTLLWGLLVVIIYWLR